VNSDHPASVRGVGVDIIEIDRVAAMIDNERFVARVFTDAEREYCDGGANRAERFAGRFAAKEAVAKALGIGLPWRDVEILRGEEGRPIAVLHGRAADAANGAHALVSISHCRAYAVAHAVICGQEPR